LKGQVKNPRLVAMDVKTALPKGTSKIKSTAQFDALKYSVAFEIEGQTVYSTYDAKRPFSANHTVAVAGEYSPAGHLIAIAFKNLTTDYSYDPRREFFTMGRVAGYIATMAAFFVWSLFSGISDPFIIAIIWFTLGCMGFGFAVFAYQLLYLMAVMKALNNSLSTKS
jgi:hypothetical protein